MQKYTKQKEFEYELQRLREILKNSDEITKLHQAQEIAAKIKGFKNWYDFQLINKQQIEYLNVFHGSKAFSEKNLIMWETMLSQEEIHTIDSHKQNKPKTFTYKEITPFKLPIFNKKVKKFLGVKNEDVFLEQKDFPMLVLGASDTGKMELQYTIAREIILRNKGYIFLNGSNYSQDNSIIHLSFFAKEAGREQDFLYLNFPNEGNDKPYFSNTINPLDMLLLNKKSFSKTFGEEISKWLFPALKSYEKKNKKVKLNSIKSFLNIPQLLLMANSDEWDNRKEVTEYLELLLIPIDGKLSDEIIKDASVRHTLNCVKAIQVTSLFDSYLNSVFSDYPEFSFEDAIKNNKILLISFPSFLSFSSLEKSINEVSLLKNIIHELIINADKQYGSKENFISFFKNSNNIKLNSNTITYSSDTYQYSLELYNFLGFYDYEKIKTTTFNNWEITTSDIDYQSYYLMNHEDPYGINFIIDNIVDKYWLYDRLQYCFRIDPRDIKTLNNGEGFLITKDDNNKKLFIQNYYFKIMNPPNNNSLIISKENV